MGPPTSLPERLGSDFGERREQVGDDAAGSVRIFYVTATRVDRRARRAKTDAEMLPRTLMAWLRANLGLL
jgi:hypothetical protein